MSRIDQTKSSIYINWAKTRAHGRFNLATSGVMSYPLGGLPVEIKDLEINGPGLYGYVPLIRALARKFDVDPDCVVHANGTSMANHLAMAATVERGDEVLIEKPAYEPLLRVAEYLGASVKRFERRRENDFLIDASELERAVSPRTRLIVLTNLHNPTGVLTDEEKLNRIGEIARDAGARVLVDEVYLEAMFDKAPRSSFHLGPQFVVTASLTKAYGLSGLRCGWIIAEPELAQKIWRLNDIFGVVAAHPAESLSVIALDNLDRVANRAKTLLEANMKLLNRFLDSRSDLQAVRPRFGTVVFPRLLEGNVDALCSLLREKYETTVVPGRYFEMPDHFRIGIGGDSDELEEGLDRLGQALDELRGTS